MSLKTVTIAEIAAPDKRSIAIGPFGSSLKADLYVPSGVPVVRGQNITEGKHLDESDLVFVAPETAARFPACMLSEGDLVFPHRGAIGRVGIVGKRQMLLSSSMMKLTVDPTKVDSRFVFYYFRGPGQRELLMRASTVGTPGIGQPLTSLRGISIRIPDLHQQRAIADVLGTLDDKIAANTLLASKAMALSQNFYIRESASADHSMQPLGQVATTVLGGTPSRDNLDFWTEGTVPWLNSGKANEDRIVQPSEYITEAALERSAAKLMPAGATVIAITGATLGQVSRLEIEASGNQSLVGVWTKDMALNDWLHFAIRDQISELLKKATGAAQQHVNKRDVDSLEVPLIESQKLARFSANASPLLEVAASADIQNLNLTSIRDALLPQLMSGKLRVKESEKVLEGAGV